MQLEIIAYLVIGLLLMGVRRILSGMKNGAFYAKNKKKKDSRIKPYINNLHRIETPAWYTQYGAVFLFSLAIFRTLTPQFTPLIFVLQIIGGFLCAFGSSAIASFFYQKWINIGSNLPEINEQENPKSEFAFRLFGKNYSIWWKRPWKGKWRIWAMVFGFIQIGLAISLIFIIKNIL